MLAFIQVPAGLLPLILMVGLMCAALAVSLFIWGFVPDEVEEEDLYGYRLTKRKRLL